MRHQGVFDNHLRFEYHFPDKTIVQNDSRRLEMRTFVVVIAVFALASVAPAQFKSQVEQETSIASTRLGGLSGPLAFMFGWFNPDKFTMRHSFDMSFTSFSGQSLSLGTYTNTMMYQFADNFNARADIAFSFSPFSNLSTFNKKDFSGVYLKNAEVNYKPWDNTTVSVSFRQSPYGYYDYYSPFYNPWYRSDSIEKK
jgi:hypothetical protein